MPKYRPYTTDERAEYDRAAAVARKKRELLRTIRERMDELGITKKRLAEEIGCCPNSMTAKLRDPGRLTGDELFGIEAVLGIETVIR